MRVEGFKNYLTEHVNTLFCAWSREEEIERALELNNCFRPCNVIYTWNVSHSVAFWVNADGTVHRYEFEADNE